MSFSILKDEKIAFSMIFSDLTLETVLKGLKILRILKDFKFDDSLKYVIRLETTIKKSSLFQLSLIYECFPNKNLIR